MHFIRNDRLVLPSEPPVLTRRDLLRAGLAGGAGALAGGSLLARGARALTTPPALSQQILQSGMGKIGTPLQVDRGPLPPRPYSPAPHMNKGAIAADNARKPFVAQALAAPGTLIGDAVAVASASASAKTATPGSLSSVTSVLNGVGLYIGNAMETYGASASSAASTLPWVFEQIASWGFQFVAPKVGGYGSTIYGSDSELKNWKTWANQAGLGFLPWIYSVPSSNIQDANICSELANDCGIAMADMEDEWESSSGAYNAAMTAFGNQYLTVDKNTQPILVTGYGDPYYAFGSAWPYSEMAAWATAYSPQWYYGEWSQFESGGVVSGVNWGDSYCGTAFGSSFPMIPSLAVTAYTGYYSSGYLPNNYIAQGAGYCSLWQAPILWWTYEYMNANRAAACLA